MVPRFIEQMPMAGGQLYVPGRAAVGGGDPRAASSAATRARAGRRRRRRRRGAGPARYWRLEPAPGDAAAARRFGIISPMTEHFCDTCNRVRLSAPGALHTCLAYDDAIDLREPLHASGARRRRHHHPPGRCRASATATSSTLVGIGGPRKAMIQIGG